MRCTINRFRTFCQDLAIVCRHIPVQYILIQIREVIPVLDTDSQILLIRQSRFYILIYFLYFKQMRMRFTIGAYQTVTAEVTETRDSFRPVITAIRPIPFTVFIYFAE